MRGWAGQIVAPGDQRRRQGSTEWESASRYRRRAIVPADASRRTRTSLGATRCASCIVAPKPAGLDLDTPSPVSYRSIIGHAPASLRPWLRLQSVYNGSLTLESGTAFGLPRWYRGFVGTPRFDPALTQAHSLSLRSTETSYSPLTHCHWPPSCTAREALGRCGFAALQPQLQCLCPIADSRSDGIKDYPAQSPQYTR